VFCKEERLVTRKFRRGILSLFVPAIMLAVVACPGVIIDNIQITLGPSGAVTGAVVTFSCFSPVTENIVSYKWFFGDGSTATGKTSTHSYASIGNYTVECHVITVDSVFIFKKVISISLPSISVGSTDFSAVDGNAVCQTSIARINISASAATTGKITKIELRTDAANTTNGTFAVRFMSLENTSGTTFLMNDHVDVSADWDTCAAGCTIDLPQALTMQAGEFLGCATNQALSITYDNEAGFSERLQTGVVNFPAGTDGVSSDAFSSLGSNLRLHLAGTN
jgi:PKD repeat protein